MKTGGLVSGELMSYENGTFRVKSKFGILSIEASDLAAIGVNTEEGIVDIVLGTSTKDSRDRITGTIDYVREGELKIKTELTIEISQQVHILTHPSNIHILWIMTARSTLMWGVKGFRRARLTSPQKCL